MKNSVTVLQGSIYAPNEIHYDPKLNRCLFTIRSEDGSFFCQADAVRVNIQHLSHGMQVKVLGYLKSFVQGKRRTVYIEVVSISRIQTQEEIWDPVTVSEVLKKAW